MAWGGGGAWHVLAWFGVWDGLRWSDVIWGGVALLVVAGGISGWLGRPSVVMCGLGLEY